jgi:hypothetical protein
VEVVRHQAVGQEPDGEAFAGLGQDCEESGVVLWMGENRGPAIATIEDVVAETAGGDSRRAWHANNIHPYSFYATIGSNV